jgi:hypothetical protein
MDPRVDSHISDALKSLEKANRLCEDDDFSDRIEDIIERLVEISDDGEPIQDPEDD